MFVVPFVSRWVRGRQPSQAVRKKARARLTLEALVDRVLPAVIHVTTLADSGAGSLRDAILRANTLPAKNAIDFQPGLSAGIRKARSMSPFAGPGR